MSRIRILLIGVSGMLNEIVRAAIASEPDMTVVDSLLRCDEGLGPFTRRHRVDVVLYPAADARFGGDTIFRLLKANPRLSLIALNGERDGGTLHRLAPTQDAIGPLAQSSLAAAIRAGAALRTQ